MKIHDATKKIDFSGNKFPVLKGHVKLTLRNVHNGKTEVVEGENIVTDAVKDIFENNPLGGIDYSKMMPLWNKWYGGVLCYEQAHANLDADKYYMKADSEQRLIAHAGQTGIDVQHDDDLRAGNPTPSSFIETENSMKQVWEWGTTHGNGTIRALSLVHSDVGSYGTGSTAYHFKNTFSPFELIQSSVLGSSNTSLRSPDNNFAQYDENHGIFFHIGDEDEFDTGDWQNTSFDTKKVTVIIFRLPYYKVGLFETIHGRNLEADSFVVEATNVKFFAQPSWYYDYENKMLWLFGNLTGANDGWKANYSNTNINYLKIDVENQVIDDEGTIISDSTSIVPLACPHRYYNSNNLANVYCSANIAKSGNYFFFPTGSLYNADQWNGNNNYIVTGYQKINISNTADQETITFDETQTGFKSAIAMGGLLINSGRVVNGTTGFTCVSQLPLDSSASYFDYLYAFQRADKPSFLALPVGSGNQSGTISRYIMASKLLLCTKYNLPSAITKTASQSMTVEYTLTEV